MFIDIHTHRARSHSGAISIRSYRFGVDTIPYDSRNISAAIHPWDVIIAADRLTELEGVLCSFDCMAEMGLDKLHDSYDLQKEIFEQQLLLAREYKKAVVIHTVRAHSDTLKILSRFSDIPTIIHSFVGSKEIAAEYLKLGCYISFSPLSFNSTKTVASLAHIPINKLFFETDDTSSLIESVYSKGAELLKIDIDILKKELFNNYSSLCFNHEQSY